MKGGARGHPSVPPIGDLPHLEERARFRYPRAGARRGTRRLGGRERQDGTRNQEEAAIDAMVVHLARRV